jgi:hypothetical protein
MEGAVSTSAMVNDVTSEESLIANFKLGDGFDYEKPIPYHG